MDADLFMECEEEELEPWQQQPSMEEPVGNAESNTFTSETNTAEPKTMVIQSLPPVVNAVSTVPLLTKPLTPQVVSADIPKPVQGQQVILTPSGGGLSTVALSQVLLPGTSPITNAANSQPFYFTTQGLPVQNIHTLQPGQSPMGLVLNVQQGQTVRPITLVQAPGTQIFKPAVGSTQIITQPAQIRGAAPIASVAQTPTSFSTVQIPATLTIRTTTGVTLPTVNSLSTMSSTTAQPSAQRTTTKILTIKPGTSPLELQNLMSLVKSVNLPGGAQAQTFVVMNHQKTNGPPVVSSAVPSTPPTVVQTIPVTNTVQSSYHSCPRCGAQFKMIEALRSHMCFCCPDAGTAAKGRTTPASNTLATQTLPKTLVVVPKVNTESSSIKGEETQSRLVMLVDDFYYGTFEGNRVYVPMDNLKEPLPFRCLTCNKKLKNNIRLMTHMRYHVELDQQNGEMGTHTSCQHCFRHFPTPFRLQCHLESVHTAVESSTTCKICEWSFESEPVFLQHMKNTHKPGEMPYVCQVCEYRSSFYPDVLKHFHTWHEDTRHLLCQYCLKVFKHSSSYQKHYVCHQKSTVYHCNKCRLQFLFTKDKVEHKVNHHKTFRKPRELEGLQPGTKVTIRAYVGQKKTSQSSSKTPVTLMNSIASSQPVNSGDQQSQKQGPGRKQVSRMFGYIVNFQEQRALLGRHKCVECTFEVPDFANHYPTYVHCSLCFYSTCCSRAYANHMINNHVAGRMAKASKRGPPSGLKLSCAECAYSTSVGNLMAKHMAKFRGHSSCIFTRRECLETDIEFCQVEEEEVEGPQGDEASDVGTQPDWLSMEHWSVPRDEGTVPQFMESCGPQLLMSKTSDALDYFTLLFPDNLFEQIVYETNAYASYCCAFGKGDPTWYPVVTEEIKGFFGLCILMGLESLPDPEMYWSSDQCQGSFASKTREVFQWTMSITRFKQIRAHIRMSSMIVENNEQSVDKLLFFQPMLNVLQTSMKDAYIPNKCLTIDQAFLPSHEKGIAREKSKNSQPRIWLLCDSKSGFCHKLLVLTQQEKHKDMGRSVVPHLIEDLQGKHHHFFLSSSLASVPLMRELYEVGIYCSTSVLPNSSILPVEFWDLPPLENPGDFQQYKYSPLLATRWKDSKQLVCLSTNAEAGQPDTVWRRSTVKMGDLTSIERPLAFKLLQDNMRGVDICNQLLTCNQLGGLSLDTNWRRLFWFLVNLSVINSFIILRETRKDRPPAWCPGGHFSQAIYRKRLGYQLAKIAERYVRRNQIFESTVLQDFSQTSIKQESSETQEGVRHRLAKISRKTKRCKVCNLLNQRHESVYGCTVCLVNLCKRSCCFWDFHGFSPNFQGNPRVGFVAPKREGMPYALDRRTKRFKAKREVHPSEDSKNSPCGADSEDQNVDQEMAPLEDTDMDTDTAESDVEPQEILNRQKGAIEVANSTLSHPAKDRDEPLSIHQRRILLLALCGGIQKASNEMSTKPNLIQSWLRDKEKQLDEVSCSRRGEAFDRLVEWVLAQREQQFPISEAKLFEKTSEMQSQTNESDSFRISYEWAVSFMLQNKLGLDVPISEHRELPHAMEENCQRFTEFVHGQIKTNNIQQCMIGAMDQLSIFVDFNLLNENTSISNEKAFQLTGSGKPFVKIYLTVLADGTVMPAMVFTTKAGSKLSERLPDSVLLMAKEEALSGTEEIEVWAARVWKQHPDWQSEKEAMLVMDSHHTRVSEDFISTVRSAKTLPAIVPVGCTGRHQPLEMCVRPVLQRLLLARWAQRSASDGTSEVQPEDVVQLLVTWLGEAMSCFSRKPEFIQHSFCLARLIPDHSQEEHTNLPGNPLELINLLLDAVSGPEVVEIDSADEEEPMETCTVSKTNLVEEPIDLTEEPEIVENEDDQTDDEDKTPTERNKIESQTQERTEDCLEIASESTDISQSSPKSDAGSNNSEQDNFSESCQDLKEPHQDPIEHRQDPTEHHQDPNEPRQDPNEPRQDPNEPRQDPTEPRQDPTEPRQDPTEPRQDPTEPRQDPSEHRKDPSEHRKDPSEPRQDPNEPRQDPIGPRQDPNEPRQDPMEPRQDPMEPRQDPTEPCQDPTEPCQDPTEPCQDPTEPCLDPTEPCLDPTEPRQDSNEPRQDPIGPRQDPIGPRQDPNEPRQDPDADQTDSASNR
ncbi:pogo transposable element with ZNF domain isoform X1 [Triplophysa rosa]|nr:pogo transposable element with ZNF domain isoform X1 [Triplophysa rosa]XP_057195711.1 pogo transposable element with ZNF domain isoform X1 [Triplophysa rosa]